MGSLRVIGLTGVIGSGKSVVASYLGSLGAYIIDADKLGHKVLEKGSPVYKRVLKAFGPSILKESGDIDRKILANIVFGKEKKRLLLNSLTHPTIKELIEEELNNALKEGYKEAVLEAAILLESPWLSFVSEVWEIKASYENCLSRSVKGKGYQPDEVKDRLEAQISARRQSTGAPLIEIDNNGSLEDTLNQVKYYFYQEKR